MNKFLARIIHALRPQHFLNFFPLPHGQGSFRPTLGIARVNGTWGPQQDGSLQQSSSSTLGAELADFWSIGFAPKTSLPPYQNTLSDAHKGQHEESLLPIPKLLPQKHTSTYCQPYIGSQPPNPSKCPPMPISRCRAVWSPAPG